MSQELLMTISGLLQAFASIARSPAIGADLDKYAALLDLLSRLVSRGADALDELRALRVEVEDMRATGRVPSLDEITAMRKRSDAAHQRLQELKQTGESPSS